MADGMISTEQAAGGKPGAKKRVKASPSPATSQASDTIAAPVADVVETPVVAAVDAAVASAETAIDRAQSVAEPVTTEVTKAVEAIVAAVPVAEAAETTSPVQSRDPIKKGLFFMSDTFNTTTNPFVSADKAQAMLGDFNARAKSAAEKGAKLVEELSEFTKGNVEALVASSKIAAQGAEAMGQDAAEYGKKSLETATTAFKSFATVKSPTELFQLQSEYAKSSFDSVVAEASKFSEAWVKLAGDVFQPLSTRFAVAAEKVKTAAL